MKAACKIGDLIILKDFCDYHIHGLYKSLTKPCVGIITEISSSSVYVQWIDDHLCTWERNDKILVISGVRLVKSPKLK